MIAAARHLFRLAKAGKDGVSAREKLQHVWETTGKRPADLDGPEPPAQLAYLLDWFAELSSGRQGNGFGANPLSWSEISAWSSLTGTVLRPWEVLLLRRMDHVFLEVNKVEAA